MVPRPAFPRASPARRRSGAREQASRAQKRVSFQVRVAFRQARLDHQPLRDRSAVRHRLLRRRGGQPGLPVHRPGRAARLGLAVGRVGQDEGRVVALDVLAAASPEMGK